MHTKATLRFTLILSPTEVFSAAQSAEHRHGRPSVSLSTKVLAKVNKGLIRSIAFEIVFIYSSMAIVTLEPSITYY